MKTHDLYKLATQKVLSDNYCVLSIKVAGDGKKNEIVGIGVVNKSEDVVYDVKFKPLENGETEDVTAKYFKNEFEHIVALLSEYDHIIVFNEKSTKRMFNQTVEKYELSVRMVDKLFKKAFCAQVLYDAYIGFMNTRLEIACKVEGVDTSDTRDVISICFILQNFIKTIASEYTHPHSEMYASIVAKSNQNKVPQVTKRKENPRAKKPDVKPYSSFFKEGKTVKEIAELLNVRETTVESHIISDYEKGAIDNIDSLIQSEYVQDILNEINKADWDGKLRSVKDVVSEDCTYPCIKAVIAKNKKGLYAKVENAKNTSDEKMKDVKKVNETETSEPVADKSTESQVEKVTESTEENVTGDVAEDVETEAIETVAETKEVAIAETTAEPDIDVPLA